MHRLKVIQGDIDRARFWLKSGAIMVVLEVIASRLVSPIEPDSLAIGVLIVMLFVNGLAFGFMRAALMKSWEARRAFYGYRVYPAVMLMRNEGYDVSWVKYPFWSFFGCKDTAALEASFFEAMRESRKRQDQERLDRKNRVKEEALLAELESVLEFFEVDEATRAGFRKSFATYRSIRNQKEFIGRIEARLFDRQWRAAFMVPVDGGSAEIERDFTEKDDLKLKNMREDASRTESSAAQWWYLAGLRAGDDRRQALRMFGKALMEERKSKALKKVAEAEAQPEKEMAPVVHLSLGDFARTKFASLRGMISEEVDWQVCREIIIALSELGKSRGRFGEHYLPEDSLLKKVRRQCDLYTDKGFDPKKFQAAIDWLLRARVLFPKPKTDERMLSLSTRSDEAEGRKIVHLVVSVNQEVRGIKR